jgi:DNA-binding MarR family transcriptional regulator
MSDHYLEVISLIERLHRQFLEVVKLELDRLRVHDLNNVQALMLYNMGDADISIGELISRGYYLGSNVSYNVKKLSDNGYLTYERSEHDRRSIRVRLTPKGCTLRGQLSDMLNRQIAMLGEGRISATSNPNRVVPLGLTPRPAAKLRAPPQAIPSLE